METPGIAPRYALHRAPMLWPSDAEESCRILPPGDGVTGITP